MTQTVAKDRNGLAILTWLGASAILYVVWVLVIAGFLRGALDEAAREGVWRFGLFFLLFQLPQALAAWLGALVTRLFIRPFNRMLLYYFSVATIILGSGVYALSILWGFHWRGIVLAVVQLAIVWLAWWLVRRAWKPTPESVVPDRR